MELQHATCMCSPLGVAIGSLLRQFQPWSSGSPTKTSLQKLPCAGFMKLVHWQGTNHGVRNGTKLKLSLGIATTFSLCSSFNRHTAYLNSSCDTAHPALAFNIVILGLHILAAEKNRLVCYAKVLGYTVCQENVPTCTSAHRQDCSLLKHSHSALQRGSTELPSQGWQEVKGMVHNREPRPT